jgi:ATP-binding cassette subfamily C protein CydD
MTAPMAPQDKEHTRRLDHWLRAEAGTVRNPLRAAVALGGLNGFLLITQCWLLAQTLNATAINHQSLATVWGYVAGIITLFILRAGVNYTGQRFAFEAGARLRTDLRARLFAKIDELGPAWSRNQRSGDLATRIVDGVEALDKYVSLYLPQMQLAVIVPVAILVFVFPADWISGLILAITAPLIPLFMILIGGQTEKLNRQQWRSLSRMGAHFFDLIEGLTTLKLFNAAGREARLVGLIAEDYRQQTMKVLRVAFLSSMVLEFLAAIGIAMVAVYVGFRLMYGEMHFLNGIFVLLLAPEFYLPLRSLGSQFHARMDALGAVEPIIELLQTDAPARPASSLTALVPSNDLPDIVFAQVDFAYPGGDPLFQGLDLTLPAGTITALVGHSGSGKSTLGQLLMGFLAPTGGHIRVGTHDLALIDPEDWRHHIAWVPQNPTLFLGTLAENIALDPKPEGHDAALRTAAKNAHALDFIERLPLGFDTMVGDRGQGLSGGEIQRIALARAFYKDAPLVILDEPSASLDPESERLITAAITRLARNRTVLVIAHRLTTVETCDQIIHLDGGRIVERGTHPELLERNGAYAALYRRYRQATS